MRRNKDDKRVLRSGNGRKPNSRQKNRNNRKLLPRRPVRNIAPSYPRNYGNPRNPRNPRRKKKSSGKLVLVMIVALVAFVIGAGIGVSLSFEENTVDEGPHYENVTKEMTSNLNSTEDVYYDKTADGVDYNQNETSQLNVKYQYSDN